MMLPRPEVPQMAILRTMPIGFHYHLILPVTNKTAVAHQMIASRLWSAEGTNSMEDDRGSGENGDDQIQQYAAILEGLRPSPDIHEGSVGRERSRSRSVHLVSEDDDDADVDTTYYPEQSDETYSGSSSIVLNPTLRRQRRNANN
uniref:Uncharacterized protein n=1 Tax=Parascaris equorum TaxID=6256 RepID=A0A914RGZ8_PAREQ